MPGCVTAMGAIAAACAGNASGIKKRLYIAEEANVASLGVMTGAVISDITMELSEVFTEWNISEGNQVFNATSEGEFESVSYVINFEAFIPKPEPAKQAILDNCNGASFVIVVEDKRAQMRIVGAPGDGIVLKVEETVAGGTPGYKIMGSLRANDLPPYFDGVVPVS